MRSAIIICLLALLAAPAFSISTDTIYVKPGDLNISALRKGDYNYVIYFRKTAQSPSSRMVMVKMKVSDEVYNAKPAIIVRQQWDRDTVYHSAYTVFSPADFSTILHQSWWKTLGYSMKFDFEAKKADYKNVSLKNGVPDSVIRKGTEGFNRSFEKYNLNWHDDLLIYTMLPYKANRTFIINYYDPGFGGAEEVGYTVTGAGTLYGSDGRKIDCWVLNHDDKNGYERFWISKKDREVLKEEDFDKTNGYRYKIKLKISESSL